MVIKYLTFVVLFLLTSVSQADSWSTGDAYREYAYLSLHVVDWGQTRQIAKISTEPHGIHNYYERNSFIGSHPTVSRVNEYFILTGIGHLLIADALPKGWRDAFQYITIGTEIGIIRRNYSMGIRVNF